MTLYRLGGLFLSTSLAYTALQLGGLCELPRYKLGEGSRVADTEVLAGSHTQALGEELRAWDPSTLVGC